jgi:hypothetical protein
MDIFSQAHTDMGQYTTGTERYVDFHNMHCIFNYFLPGKQLLREMSIQQNCLEKMRTGFFACECVCVCVHVFMYVCVCVCVYIYIYIDTHTHAYTRYQITPQALTERHHQDAEDFRGWSESCERQSG